MISDAVMQYHLQFIEIEYLFALVGIAKFCKRHLQKIKKCYIRLGSRKIPPGKIPTRKIPTHQTLPWKIPPRKIPTQKIPTWNIHTHFINCLSSLFLHLIFRP